MWSVWWREGEKLEESSPPSPALPWRSNIPHHDGSNDDDEEEEEEDNDDDDDVAGQRSLPTACPCWSSSTTALPLCCILLPCTGYHCNPHHRCCHHHRHSHRHRHHSNHCHHYHNFWLLIDNQCPTQVRVAGLRALGSICCVLEGIRFDHSDDRNY